MLSATLLPIRARLSSNIAVWLTHAGQHCSLSRRLERTIQDLPQPRLTESCDALSLGEFANAPRGRCERNLSTARRLGAGNPRDEQRDPASTRAWIYRSVETRNAHATGETRDVACGQSAIH